MKRSYSKDMEWTVMKPNKLPLTLEHTSSALAGTRLGIQNTFSWVKPTMAVLLFMVGVCKKAEPGASGVLEMQRSKRRDLTESEMDEPKSKANRQS